MENPKIDLSKREEQFFNFDTRSPSEKQHQEQVIESLSQRNKELFSCINLPKKPKIENSLPHLIRTLKFSDGWYVKYTDNIDAHSHFRYKIPVLSIHGCPGNYQDWVGLENSIGSNQFRMINFFVPGFDGDPEIGRGDYDGSMEDAGRLVKRLLDHLGIGRVVFMLHSMGGYLMFCFCQKLWIREKVAGLIYVAAPSINWYVGYVVFYGVMAALNHMNRQNGAVSLLNVMKYRRVLWSIAMRKVAEINMEGVKFPNLTENEFCAFVKLMTSVPDVSNVYSYSKKMPRILKLMACGKNDPINEFEKFIECFYYNVFGEGSVKEEEYSESVKKNIRIKIKKNEEFEKLDLDFKNLQKNFVFNFEKTGHNVHRKRCRELAKPIRCYIAIIDAIEEIHMKQQEAKL